MRRTFILISIMLLLTYALATAPLPFPSSPGDGNLFYTKGLVYEYNSAGRVWYAQNFFLDLNLITYAGNSADLNASGNVDANQLCIDGNCMSSWAEARGDAIDTYFPFTVAQGGTGKSSWTPVAIPYAIDSDNFGEILKGNAGQYLIVNTDENGYEWASGVGISDHNALNHLIWTEAGHIIDTFLDMATNFISFTEIATPATPAADSVYLYAKDNNGESGLFFITDAGNEIEIGSGGAGAVDSVFGRTGVVVAESNDYTWALIDKTTSSIADINERSYYDLQNLPYIPSTAAWDSNYAVKDSNLVHKESDETIDGIKTFTSFLVTPSASPASDYEVANKAYVDAIAVGLSWRHPVIDKNYTSPPDINAVGDRHIIALPASGTWAGKDNNIAEWNGSTWIYSSPQVGWAVITTVDNLAWVFTADNNWVQLASPPTYTSGAGISIISNEVSVDIEDNNGLKFNDLNDLALAYDNNKLGVVSNNLTVKPASITDYELSGVGTAKGGTGLTSIGTANQIMGVNSGASGLEYKTLIAGDNVTIDHAVNSITISSSGGDGNGSSDYIYVDYPMMSHPSSAYTWTNMPAALTALSYSAKKVNLSGAVQYRIVVNQSVVGFTTARFRALYSTNGSTYLNLDGDTNSGDLNVGAGTGVKVGSWTDLTAGAKTDVWIQMYGLDGNGIVDPAWRQISVQAKYNSSVSDLNESNVFYGIVDIISTPSTSNTWTNMPAAVTEFLGNTYDRRKVDLSSYSQYRIVVNQATAGFAGADLDLQYSNDLVVWNAADTAGAGEVDVGTGTGVKTGSWASLTGSAKDDVYIRLVGKEGNGVVDPVWRQTYVEFKGYLDALPSTITDTNWQTSWTTFDTNMKSYYALKTDQNYGDDKIREDTNFLISGITGGGIDTNTFTAGIQNPDNNQFNIDLNTTGKISTDKNVYFGDDQNYFLISKMPITTSDGTKVTVPIIIPFLDYPTVGNINSGGWYGTLIVGGESSRSAVSTSVDLVDISDVNNGVSLEYDYTSRQLWIDEDINMYDINIPEAYHQIIAGKLSSMNGLLCDSDTCYDIDDLNNTGTGGGGTDTTLDTNIPASDHWTATQHYWNADQNFSSIDANYIKGKNIIFMTSGDGSRQIYLNDTTLNKWMSVGHGDNYGLLDVDSASTGYIFAKGGTTIATLTDTTLNFPYNADINAEDATFTNVNVGSSDKQYGKVEIFGHSDGTSGILNLYNGDTYDSVTNLWQIRGYTSSGDFGISPNTAQQAKIKINATADYNITFDTNRITTTGDYFMSRANAQINLTNNGDVNAENYTATKDVNATRFCIGSSCQSSWAGMTDTDTNTVTAGWTNNAGTWLTDFNIDNGNDLILNSEGSRIVFDGNYAPYSVFDVFVLQNTDGNLNLSTIGQRELTFNSVAGQLDLNISGDIALSGGAANTFRSFTLDTKSGGDSQFLSIVGGGKGLEFFGIPQDRGGYINLYGDDYPYFNYNGSLLYGTADTTGQHLWNMGNTNIMKLTDENLTVIPAIVNWSSIYKGRQDSNTTIEADTNIILKLDADNNESGFIKVLDGAGADALTISEIGDVNILGVNAQMSLSKNGDINAENIAGASLTGRNLTTGRVAITTTGGQLTTSSTLLYSSPWLTSKFTAYSTTAGTEPMIRIQKNLAMYGTTTRLKPQNITWNDDTNAIGAIGMYLNDQNQATMTFNSFKKTGTSRWFRDYNEVVMSINSNGDMNLANDLNVRGEIASNGVPIAPGYGLNTTGSIGVQTTGSIAGLQAQNTGAASDMLVSLALDVLGTQYAVYAVQGSGDRAGYFDGIVETTSDTTIGGRLVVDGCPANYTRFNLGCIETLEHWKTIGLTTYADTNRVKVDQNCYAAGGRLPFNIELYNAVRYGAVTDTNNHWVADMTGNIAGNTCNYTTYNFDPTRLAQQSCTGGTARAYRCFIPFGG